MLKLQTLEDFYQNKSSWLPGNLRQELGHFNVFRLADFVGPKAYHLAYSRKDFYKISLVTGRSNYHFADQTHEIRGTSLLFATPHVPYQWEPIDEQQLGYFCIFTEAFLQRNLVALPPDLPLFMPGTQPLDKAEQTAANQLFEQMLMELHSDYVHKYDLVRTYLFTLMHRALKARPTATLYHDRTATARIAAQFTELLEQQFPIERPSQQVRLRTATAFADRLALHVNYLNRVLKEATGKTTTELISSRLVHEAHALLKHTSWNVAEIAYCLGFEQTAHFSTFFRKHTGWAPSAVRHS